MVWLFEIEKAEQLYWRANRACCWLPDCLLYGSPYMDVDEND